MIKKLISLKIVALLLLAFVGQVTASTAIYCEMMDSASSEMSDHSGHDMSGHESHFADQADNQSNGQSSDSCCDELGACSMNGCLPVAFIATTEADLIRLIPAKISSYNEFIATQTLNSLYRPPILS